MRNERNGKGPVVFFIICGVILLSGLFSCDSEPECIEIGCDNEAASGSSYCYLHKTYSGGSSYKGYSNSSTSSYKGGSSSSSSYKGGSSSSTSYKGGSSSSSSYKSNSSSSSSKNNSYSNSYNYYDSYDEGYEDVYENDDYDWDRYWEDDDYASGVDDAMDELGW